MAALWPDSQMPRTLAQRQRVLDPRMIAWAPGSEVSADPQTLTPIDIVEHGDVVELWATDSHVHDPRTASRLIVKAGTGFPIPRASAAHDHGCEYLFRSVLQGSDYRFRRAPQ